MKARWCLVGAVSVFLAFSLARTRTQEQATASISAEPVAPAVTENVPQESAGVALPLATPPTSPRRPSKYQDKTSLEVDTVEPWTGEDLAPVVVAARGGRPTFDRHDPWNTAVVHDVNPAHDMPLDESDPWNEIVSLKKKPAPPKTQLALEKSSPWGETSSASITSL